MANTWNIRISQNADGTVTFEPDVPNGQPGQPLGVLPNDLVTWNNTTNQELKLQASNPPGLFLTNPIPAGQVSDPIFSASTIPSGTTTVTYSCVAPSLQQHSIVVITASGGATV
jgi:hypothetical protein